MMRALACFFVVLTFSSGSQPLLSQTPSQRWQETESSVALLQGENVLWQFNHGPSLSVPYFHPVSTACGRVLTWDRPSDHVWHHGLWFCWKYVNGVNYWEHDRKTGKPAGRTEWTDLQVETRDDHSARIELALSYYPAVIGEIVLSEQRVIDISAPNPQGEYHFDWNSVFSAGDKPVELDRTPPKEQSWGGYAGLSVRFAKAMTDRQATSSTGPVQFGPGNRHRSRGSAMDYSGIINQKAVGLALLDHPSNPRYPTPWYVIRSPVMSYFNAALLHDEPMILEDGQRMTLRYRLIVHPRRWDAEQLKTAQAVFWRSVSPAEP